jgi:molybdopterin molybdotransferase
MKYLLIGKANTRAVHNRSSTARQQLLGQTCSRFAISLAVSYDLSMAAQVETRGILSFEQARSVVEEKAAGLKAKGRELVSLLECQGRVLAESIPADRDFPPFPRAARDGYAVRAADVEPPPAELAWAGEIKAGAQSLPALKPGQAIEIMTGAPCPQGADAVVMVEQTERRGTAVVIRSRVLSGDNIVAAGSEAKRGDELVRPGSRLGYAEIAMAAAVGRSRLVVNSKPAVAVLSTGDEVVDVDVPPARNQIRNSNAYSLAAQIQAAGGEPVLLPIAPDQPGRLRELLSEGLESDLLLVSGGVSMGKYDLVESSLAERHADFFFTGALIQPGRPIVFGRVPGAGRVCYFFGLPGNPVSTMVTFELFARPVVEALAGMAPRKLTFTHARLKTAIRTKTGLKRFLPARLWGEFERAEVELAAWKGSGDIASVVRSNCYVVVPPERERIEAGEWIPVLLR